MVAIPTASNENRTHIYRIRRKEDGLFLAYLGEEAGGHLWKGYWQPIGVFWRKPETVRKHLLELCTLRVYSAEFQMNSWGPGGNIHRSLRSKGKSTQRNRPPQFTVFPHDTKIRVSSIHYQWLDYYEVVATEITVHGESVMEARDFASFLKDEMVS